MDDETIIFATSKAKSLRILLGSAVLMAGGIGMLRGGHHVWLGWFCAVCFALGIPLSLVMLYSGMGALRIHRRGFEIATVFRPSRLSWDDVNSFHVDRLQAGIASHKVIRIDYSDAYRRSHQASRVVTGLTGMGGALPNHFRRPVEDVCEALNRAKTTWGRGDHDELHDGRGIGRVDSLS